MTATAHTLLVLTLGVLSLMTTRGLQAAAFSELVSVLPNKNLACTLGGQQFDICPEFKGFPGEFVRYEVPAGTFLRLPEIAPFHRSVVKVLPKAVWLQQLSGPGQGRFLSTPKGNYVTVYTCRPESCTTHQYVFVMETAYRKKWALHYRKDAGAAKGAERLRWFGDPDEQVKAVLLAARALHTGEKPVPLSPR
ncbi:MAG: Ivy family c-type lysozyme inhibitor [Burkholderiales bacterium]